MWQQIVKSIFEILQLSYGVGYLMFDNPLFRLGLFVLGCCPGGTGSNFWCLLLNGDINLSITMTFISTVAALGMMPFWLLILGTTISDDTDLKIPYIQLISTLLTLIVPISLGMWIRHRYVKYQCSVKNEICAWAMPWQFPAHKRGKL